MAALTDEEKAILTFARRWYKYAGKQEQDIRDEFGISATRYWAKFNVLLDRPVRWRSTGSRSTATAGCGKPVSGLGVPGV